jgi:two-component system sensor histidine kinase RegB
MGWLGYNAAAMKPSEQQSGTLLFLAGSRVNLKRLLIIRSIALAGQTAALLYAWLFYAGSLVYPVLISTLLLLLASIVVTTLRLRKPWPVTDEELFAQLMLDVACFTVLVYFTGGATNPFVSYYLVPLSIAAATLPWRHTWLIAVAALACYSTMLFFYHPIPELAPEHQHGSQSGNLHILGMWFNFLISTVLITFFVVRMAAALRNQEEVITHEREERLKDEHILSLATLAAGTAHELGTPLNTITLLLDDLAEEHRDNNNLLPDIQLLQTQVRNCRNSLEKLTSNAKDSFTENFPAITPKAYFDALLAQWQLIRPEVSITFNYQESDDAPESIQVDPTLGQTLINLLDNAADVSPQRLLFDVECITNDLIVRIRDFGPGLPLEVAEQLGKPFVTTKGEGGLGLGLLLSHATAKRYNASITLYDHAEGGTLTELVVPLESLVAQESPDE